jgi:pilus assembly protein CpaB
MRTGTVISLGASAVLGVGALIVARVWLPQSNQHAQAGKPAQVSATVPVVVASSAIPYGGKVDQSHLTIVQLPAGAVPPGAYSDPKQIMQRQGGVPIALIPIAAREPVLPGKLSGGGARAIVSAGISEGMRAYTINVGEAAGVGGHVLPGDRVDVIVTREPPTPKAVKDLCGDCKFERADVVLQDVKVLGMDLNADPTTTQSVVAHTATLEVSVQDAQKLAVAAQIGTMSLALRRVGQAEITPVRTIDVGDVKSTAPRAPGRSFPDDMHLGAGLRPHTAPSPGHAGGHTRTIIVVHGDSTTQIDVPAERYGRGA